MAPRCLRRGPGTVRAQRGVTRARTAANSAAPSSTASSSQRPTASSAPWTGVAIAAVVVLTDLRGKRAFLRKIDLLHFILIEMIYDLNDLCLYKIRIVN